MVWYGIHVLAWLGSASGPHALSTGGPRSRDPLVDRYLRTVGRRAGTRPRKFARVPECEKPHYEDSHTPISQVAARHPGEDLFCHYGFVGHWVSECAAARKKKDYGHFYRTVSNGLKVIRRGDRPWQLRFDNYTITTRDHHHPLDDALCTVNGFYDIPRDEIFDWQAMNERSSRHCEHLRQLFGADKWSKLSMADFMREEIRDSSAFMRALKHYDFRAPRPQTLHGIERSMLLHEAVKCLLGTSACDMAYCAGRGCKDPGDAEGRIIYSPTKGCPNLPLKPMREVRNKTARSRIKAHHGRSRKVQRQ